MKITKEQLKQIIKEELAAAFEGMSAGDVDEGLGLNLLNIARGMVRRSFLRSMLHKPKANLIEALSLRNLMALARLPIGAPSEKRKRSKNLNSLGKPVLSEAALLFHQPAGLGKGPEGDPRRGTRATPRSKQPWLIGLCMAQLS